MLIIFFFANLGFKRSDWQVIDILAAIVFLVLAIIIVKDYRKKAITTTLENPTTIGCGVLLRFVIGAGQFGND